MSPDASGGPSWFDLGWFLLTSILVAVVSWVAKALVEIRRNAGETVRLLRWLKDEHEDPDSTFSTTHIVPLLERAVRVSKGTQEIMRWVASKVTGETPPPPTEGD